jgi:CheY-like chemotaxis protein
MTVATASWVQVVQTIPSLLWAAFAFAVLIAFRQQIAELLPKLKTLRLPGGVEADFAAAVSGAAAAKQVDLPPATPQRLLRRASADAQALRGTRVLWIDDHLDSVVQEQRALEALGVRVDIASSENRARFLLGTTPYDLIISDMRRGTNANAGRAFLDEIRAAHHAVPLIFYVAEFAPDRGTPPHAFAITNRPDDLIDYVMDVIERSRI